MHLLNQGQRKLLVAAALLLLFLAACVPAGAQQAPQQAGIVSQGDNTRTPKPTATASPIIVPTIDAALVARITASWVDLTEAQAKQAAIAAQASELDYRLTASAATMTAEAPAATKTALLLVYADKTQTQKTAIVETQAIATQRAVDHVNAQRRAGSIAGAVAFLLWALAIWGAVSLFANWRRRRLENLLLENELEIQRRELEPETTALPDVFTNAEHTRVLTPIMPTGVTDENIRLIARWVIAHDYTWSDAMRDGRGVGLSHPLLKSYRDGYLERVGALVRQGQGWIVTGLGREYFERKAALPQAGEWPETDVPTVTAPTGSGGGS